MGIFSDLVRLDFVSIDIERRYRGLGSLDHLANYVDRRFSRQEVCMFVKPDDSLAHGANREFACRIEGLDVVRVVRGAHAQNFVIRVSIRDVMTDG